MDDNQRTLIEPGEYYDLITGTPYGEGFAGFPICYQILNKDTQVIEAEGLQEVMARVYLHQFNDTKSRFVEGGIYDFLDLPPEGPVA